VLANVVHNDENMKLFQRFHRQRFRRKRFTKSSVSYEDDDCPLDDLTGITKRTKKKKTKGGSLLLPSSMTRRFGLRRKQKISFDILVEDDSGRCAEDGAMPSHSRPRDYPVYVDMGGIINFRAYDYDTVHKHSGGCRNGKKKTTNLREKDPFASFVKSRTKSLKWNTSAFTTITIDQSMEDEDIGETTT
jgi:hypothetical protein